MKRLLIAVVIVCALGAIAAAVHAWDYGVEKLRHLLQRSWEPGASKSPKNMAGGARSP